MEKAGHLHEAEVEYQWALRSNPTFAPACRRLGAVLFASGDTEGALQELRKANDLSPGDTETLFLLGRVLTSKKRYSESVALFKEALLRAPQTPGLYLGLGSAYLAARDFGSALEAIRKACHLAPDNPEAHFLIAAAYQQAGDLTRAAYHLRETLHIAPDHVPSRVQLASIYAKQEEWLKALRQYRLALRTAPANLALVQGAAQVGLKVKDGRDAVPFLREWMRLDPSAPQPVGKLAERALAARNFGLARRYLRKLASLTPRDQSVRLRIAQCDLTLHEWDAALADVEQAMESGARGVTPRLVRAAAFEGKGDWRSALVEYDRVLTADPANADALARSSKLLLSLREVGKALVCLRRLVQVAPKSAEAFRYLARTEDWLAFSSEAEGHWQTVRKLGPRDVEAFIALGRLSAARGDLPQAERRFAGALHLAPQSLELRRALAEAWLQAGQPEKAERVCTEALKRNPANVALLYTLAQARASRLDYASALEALKRARRAAPKSALIALAWGRALELCGRDQEAARAYQDAASIPRADAEAALRLGRALERLGKTAEAEAAYRRALSERAPAPSARASAATALLAALLDRMGRGSEALTLFRAVRDNGGNSATEAYVRCLLKTVGWAKAESELSQGLQEEGGAPIASALAALLKEPELRSEVAAFAERQVATAPSSRNALWLLARVREAGISGADVLTLWEQATTEHPEELDLGLDYAGELEKAKRLDESIAAYRKLSQQIPLSPVVYVGMARALATLGRAEEALVQARTCLRVFPKSELGYSALVDLYQQGKRLDLAVWGLEELRSRDPDNPAILAGLSSALALAGRTSAALALAECRVRLQPDSREGLLQLADCYHAAGRQFEAMQVCRQLLDSSPNLTEAQDRLARWTERSAPSRSANAMPSENRAVGPQSAVHDLQSARSKKEVSTAR